MTTLARAQSNTESVTLQDAIKSRNEVTALQQEAGGLDRDVLELMRKVVAKADGKQMEGNILLTKDLYGEAVQAFQEATRLYQRVVDGRKLLEQLAKAERAVAAARMLAESIAKPEQLQEGKRLQIKAEGFAEAGELDQALPELVKAREAFEKLLAPEGPVTFDQAVAARDQIKNLPKLSADRDEDALAELKQKLGVSRRESSPDSTAKGTKPGSLSDLLSRAQKSAEAGLEAMEERQYTLARALFVAADKLYRDASVLQTKRDAFAASRKIVEDSLNLADKAFKGSARPASFERGKQALADADKALGDDDIDTAKSMLSQAAEQFAAAWTEADKFNAQVEAQQALADAAKTKENAPKAGPVIARLETAVASRDKFGAEDVLAELEMLIPSDPRMAALRDKVAALPGPKKKLTVDLGGGVTMEMVLLRPGSFTMGSDKNSDERPMHEVTFPKPFYIGKYEVTQEQWLSVMGNNPSGFQGAKYPVEQVSWDDCQNFLAKLKEKVPGQLFSLPTEAQWEYACRAGSTGDYCYGDGDGELRDYAWYRGNANNTPHPVGGKKPNAWGLYDMHGNVWEWCQDVYHASYEGAPSDGSPWMVGRRESSRVLRGGSGAVDASFLRSAVRIPNSPGNRPNTFGLRLVRAVGTP